VRGVGDCVVIPDRGPATVLEFKTGPRRPEHARQGREYEAAIQEILGKTEVDLKILYV
jgi:hypothetical protein